MPDLRRICVVTGARSDYNFLQPVMKLLHDDPGFSLQVVVTGQHTVVGGPQGILEMLQDGFRVDAKIDIDLVDDDAIAVAHAMGRVVSGVSEVLTHLKPHLMLFVGDRYEILAAAQAGLLCGVPMGHIAGGDITEGAIDDSIRHCLTKLSHLHFTTNEQSARRVLQMGENPSHVYIVGSPSLDRILSAPFLSREQFFAEMGLPPERTTLLVTFHPATQSTDSKEQCAEMLAALEALGSDVNIIFTGVNADPGAQGIHSIIVDFCECRGHTKYFYSLGAARYYSALRYAHVVVGNSSSGLYEAPSFKIPTVNIGDRQDGRLRAESIIDCEPERGKILAALKEAFVKDCSHVRNPYGDGGAARRIVEKLKSTEDYKPLLRKKFNMLGSGQ